MEQNNTLPPDMVNASLYIQPDPKANGALKSQVPVGFTGQGCIWYAATAPAGWLICDGSLQNKADYPDLWLLLGSTWGTATATQFYLPDLRQRVPVGKHSSGTFSSLNGSGGSETHTLTVAQMPSHTHIQNSHYHNSGHFNSTYQTLVVSGGAYTLLDGVSYGYNRAGAFATATNQNTGGGESHNNLQPYRVVNFIIKT